MVSENVVPFSRPQKAILVSALLVAVAGVIVGVWLVLPMTGTAEKSVTAKDLADLGLRSVEYMQGLTTAVVGGAVLVLGQRFLGRARLHEDRRRRLILAYGLMFLAMSLATGFVTLELLIEVADQRLIDEKMESLRVLRLLQSGYLLVGVCCIGGTLVWDIVSGIGEVRDD